jgi:Fic family protein
MKVVRGSDKLPGNIRTSQNWIGGSRPGNARFVPPPPDAVPAALADLERWIHRDDGLPPLVRIGLAHVQFETIHPFLDGNGRIGRLLVTLLMEHWHLQSAPLLYLSLSFKRRREEYYRRLSAVRTDGDWEGWTAYFLECVLESANDAVEAARGLFKLMEDHRRKLLNHSTATLPSIRLFDLLPEHPMVTLASTVKLLKTSKPTALKAIAALRNSGVLHEITGKRRDRVFAYRDYLKVLSADTELPDRMATYPGRTVARKRK